MKKLTFKILALFLLSGAYVSCNELKSDSVVQEQTVTIHADPSGYSQTATKSAIVQGNANGTDYVFMQWLPTDKIGVFSINPDKSKKDVNAQFENITETPSNTAEFSGLMFYAEPGISKIYAYSPYYSSCDPFAVKANIPPVIEYRDEQSIQAYDYKAANMIPLPSAEGRYNFSANFQQMTSLFQFRLHPVQIAEIIGKDLTGCNIKSVKISIKDEDKNQYIPLSGTFTYDLTQLEKGLALPADYDNSMENSLTVKLTDPVSLTATEYIFYAPIVPGKTKGTKLYCDVQVSSTNGNKDYHLKFAANVLTDFKVSVYYTVNIDKLTYDKAKAQYPQDASIVENVIKTEETANCYIVEEAGVHDFNATVIGNGEKGIIKGAGFHTENPYISPKSAKLLWQDMPGFISNVQLLENGRVQYKANTNIGNAVIAVYDQPDGRGNVLWSWHIWGIGDEPIQTEQYINKANYTFEVMDRNLGAHSKHSASATLYQWGRKDPFTNAGTYYAGAEETPSDISQSYPMMDGTAPNYLVEQIQHPDRMMNSSTDPNYGRHYELWGDGNTQNFKTDDQRADNKWFYRKTIYDPSPAGYRVAGKFTFTNFVTYPDGDSKEGQGETVNARKQNANQPFLVFDDGYYFYRTPADKEGSYYPLAGYRSHFNSGFPYHSGFYWTSGRSTSEGQASLMTFTQPGKVSAGSAPKYGRFKVTDIFYMQSACAIRCVKDDESLVINR